MRCHVINMTLNLRSSYQLIPNLENYVDTYYIVLHSLCILHLPSYYTIYNKRQVAIQTTSNYLKYNETADSDHIPVE